MYLMRKIINDDAEYLLWVEKHPDGWVVNCANPPSPGYLMLHRAECWTIKTPARTNWTTRAYIKVCSDDREKLQAWASDVIQGKLAACQLCKP